MSSSCARDSCDPANTLSKQWYNQRQDHAFPILGEKPVDQITTADVLAVLTPIWARMPETARRIRQRLHTILDWARAAGHRHGDNPVDLIGDPALLAAWSSGQTGFPFLDACMRSLKATGWLNFRMRAMLVSFASYNLRLPWRPTGLHLACQFTDYEAGIHWPQVQMQSGTTGINTIRIYNVVKQGHDQDPTGDFVRRWVPELADVPAAYVQEPWTWEGDATIIGRTYPTRIVDLASSTRSAKDQIYGLRRAPAFHATSDKIQDKHGSRKSGMKQAGRRRRKSRSATAQLKLDL